MPHVTIKLSLSCFIVFETYMNILQLLQTDWRWYVHTCKISFELPSHIHRSLLSDTTKTLVECHIGDKIHNRRNKIDTEMIEVESLYFCVTHYFLGDMQDCRSILSIFQPIS